MIPLGCALLLTAAPAYAQETSQERWESRDRGQVLFYSRLWEQDVNVLCVLHLPERSLELLTDSGPLEPDISGIESPTWGPDTTLAYFSGKERGDYGLYQIDRVTNETRLIPLEGVWRQGAGQDDYIGVPMPDGTVVAVKPPGVRVGVLSVDFTPKDSTLWALVWTGLEMGPPGWELSPDSMNLPGWLDESIRAGLAEERVEWIDLLSVDSAGPVSWVRRFDSRLSQLEMYRTVAASPDGRFFALTWREVDVLTPVEVVHVYDRQEQQILIPGAPGDKKMRSPAFSPDGGVLAAVSWGADTAGVWTCRTPAFEEFELMYRIERGVPESLCWSPDGEWLIVVLTGSFNDLIVLDVATAEHVDIPRPYLLNDRPAPEIGVSSSHVDWID